MASSTAGHRQLYEEVLDDRAASSRALELDGDTEMRKQVWNPACAKQRFLATALLLASVASLLFLLMPGLEARLPRDDSSANSGITSLDSNPCASPGESCSESMCCEGVGMQCFEKNDFWASCRDTCVAGLDPNDPTDDPWSCKFLGVTGMWDYNLQRSKKLLANLTFDEKVLLLHGQSGTWPNDRHGFAGYVSIGWAYTDPWQKKGIMPLTMNDGPQGYNTYGGAPGTTTQLPALLTVAASFDPAASARYAKAVAEEFVQKGANVLLGPDVEVTRAPLCGRSFETLSGEDPFLGSRLVQPYVKVVQDHGIIATVKHFLNNNQEIYRQSMNVEVDDRAQHEIYTPVFKAAFDAGAGGVMCAYNKVYGKYACENPKLLKKLLREDLGFKGFVVSDWGATHNAESSANAGLDIDMQLAMGIRGSGEALVDEFHKLPDLVTQGKVSQETIDSMATHVLTAMHVVGQLDGRYPVPEPFKGTSVGVARAAVGQIRTTDTTSDEHREVAKQTIIDGSVLLKNAESTLPLHDGAKIAMIGKACKSTEDQSLKQGSVFSGGGSGYVETNHAVSPFAGMQARLSGVLWSADASAGAGVDVAVVCVAAHSEEGWDRKDYAVPDAQDLVWALRQQPGKKKIVVVAAVPGAVTTEWIDEVDAALILFMPGEQVGAALAALLTGDSAPGGRLPVSFPKVGESRFTAAQYPGECEGPKAFCPWLTAHFTESVLVGYRWNDAKNVPSAFPFGHGLTYTLFEFGAFESKCDGEKVAVSLNITNTGDRPGAAVPQLYVSFPSLQPTLRQLRGFQKVWIAAGQTGQAGFLLGEEDWSFYSEQENKWVSARKLGEDITVFVGSSSTDLHWNSTLSCLYGNSGKHDNETKGHPPLESSLVSKSF